MIKIQKKNVIDVADWDDLVENTYDRIYNFQQQEGCQSRGTYTITIPEEHNDEERNDSIPEEINGDVMGVKFDAWLTRNPEEWNGKKQDKMFLDLFWERNFYPHIQAVANDLYAKGLIEKGEYDIKIDW